MKNGKDTSILIVDNDPVWITLLSSLIEEECGIIPSFVFSGECALKHISSQEVDLILTATRMTEMNGIELIQHIREMKKNVIILIFFDPFPDLPLTKQDVLALGADGVLNKSDFMSLPDFIRQVI